MWWRHERLHRSVLLDYTDRLSSYRRERDGLEKLWISRANALADDERWELTQEAFVQAQRKTGEWIDNVQSRPVRRPNKWTYRQYWQHQNACAAIDVN